MASAMWQDVWTIFPSGYINVHHAYGLLLEEVTNSPQIMSQLSQNFIYLSVA